MESTRRVVFGIYSLFEKKSNSICEISQSVSLVIMFPLNLCVSRKLLHFFYFVLDNAIPPFYSRILLDFRIKELLTPCEGWLGKMEITRLVKNCFPNILFWL